MRQRHGRFLFPIAGAELKLTDAGLQSGPTDIVRKSAGCFFGNQEFRDGGLRVKASKIADLLTKGRNAEAIFLASFVNWEEKIFNPQTSGVGKAGFNSSEPRDEYGRWSSDVSHNAPSTSSPVIPIASADDPRGNKMARDAARAAGLDRAQRRRLHDLITGQGITDFQTILQIAKDIASGGA